jgi:hypothetical protein
MATKKAKTTTRKRKATPEVDAVLEKETIKVLKSGPKSISKLKTLLPGEETNEALARTLQRLRRQGKIKLVKGQWAVSTIEVCPQCGGKGWVET